jgi:hypothetical protein
MESLILEKLILGEPKIATKEYALPVAKITPQFKTVETEDGEVKVLSSGCISLNAESATKLAYLKGKETTSRISVSMARTATIIYDSTSLTIDESCKKKLPDSRVLRISREALEAIYGKHGLDVNDAWVFELVDGCIDLAGVKDLKVLVLKPLEKRA